MRHRPLGTADNSPYIKRVPTPAHRRPGEQGVVTFKHRTKNLIVSGSCIAF